MGYFWSLSRERLLCSNGYALSQNYGAVHIVATLSYNIPKSRPYFLCIDLVSLVVAVSEMAPFDLSKLQNSFPYS